MSHEQPRHGAAKALSPAQRLLGLIEDLTQLGAVTRDARVLVLRVDRRSAHEAAPAAPSNPETMIPVIPVITVQSATAIDAPRRPAAKLAAYLTRVRRTADLCRGEKQWPTQVRSSASAFLSMGTG